MPSERRTRRSRDRDSTTAGPAGIRRTSTAARGRSTRTGREDFVATIEFHHMGVVCSDMGATERFYTKHFGFRRARVAPLGGGDQIVFLKAGSCYLELFRATQANPAPAASGPGPEYPGWRHL